LLPQSLAPMQQQERSRWSLPPLAFVALTALFIESAAAGGAWAYMELLANQHHFSAMVVAIAISLGLLIQVLGALGSGLFGRRVPTFAGLLIVVVGQALTTLWLAKAQTPVSFLIPSLLFSVLLLAPIPYQVRMMLLVDESRRAAQLGNSVGLFGVSLGPSFIALGVRGSDVSGAFLISAGLLVVCAATFTFLSRRVA
jgi:hypothetical protein